MVLPKATDENELDIIFIWSDESIKHKNHPEPVPFISQYQSHKTARRRTRKKRQESYSFVERKEMEYGMECNQNRRQTEENDYYIGCLLYTSPSPRD